MLTRYWQLSRSGQNHLLAFQPLICAVTYKNARRRPPLWQKRLLSLSSATHATNQAYFQDLQQSLQIPGFVGAFVNALWVTKRENIEECDARSDSSISTSKSHTEHEVALADVFHDCILVAHRRLNRSWNDWVHIAEVVREMQALVPNWHTTLWNEWTLEEQLEACFALADAYQSIDVV